MTLNQVVKNLNYIANAHNQINHFFFGELYNFASSGTTNYPAMAVTVEPATYSENMLTMNFNVYILDLVHKDLSNQTEVLSDTQSICLDVLALIKDPTIYSWNIDINTTLTDIQGGYDDEVSGYWFPLKIRVPKPLDTCQVPLRSALQVVPDITEDNSNITNNNDLYILTGGGITLGT